MFYNPDEIRAITEIVHDFSRKSAGPLAVAMQDALTRVHDDEFSLGTLFTFRCALVFFASDVVDNDASLKHSVDTALSKTTAALKTEKAIALN
ncbi:MAG TPA: hypothetical protein VN512_13110 [Clostridia bacterium]|nr:hypothetical protein [Clostridia bacterium]